jgi:hypothetical protein
MTVTDRAKKDQPWRCVARDQSVQIFSLPYNKHLWAAGPEAEAADDAGGEESL